MINCCGSVLYSVMIGFIEISYADIPQNFFGKKKGGWRWVYVGLVTLRGF